MAQSTENPITAYVLNLLDTEQLIAVAIVLFGAWLIKLAANRLIRQMSSRLHANKEWVPNLVAIVTRINFPLIALLLNLIVAELFRELRWNTGTIEIASQLISLWLLYRLLATIVGIYLSPQYARFWSRKVLLPILVFGGILSFFGVLGTILNWGFTIGAINWTITIGGVLFAALTVVLFGFAAKWAQRGLAESFFPRAGFEITLGQTLSKMVGYGIAVLGVLLAMSAVGIDLTAITVIAGGVSVGLAFGLQEIFNNFISGFIILFERSIEPGDVIEVSAATGIVQRVGIRSTTITTRDNVELIIPNSHFLTNVVTNMTRSEDLVRIRVAVGVSYKANPPEVKEALLAAAHKHTAILTEPEPTVVFKNFGESSLDFELLVWTDQAIRAPLLTSDLRYNIWDELVARHIEIPFPQRDIHIRSAIPWDNLHPKETSHEQHS